MVKAMPRSMTHKQPDMLLSELWSETVSFGAPLRKVGAKLMSLVKIPVGYQDETGFHYGQEPVLNKAQRPTA